MQTKENTGYEQEYNEAWNYFVVLHGYRMSTVIEKGTYMKKKTSATVSFTLLKSYFH